MKKYLVVVLIIFISKNCFSNHKDNDLISLSKIYLEYISSGANTKKGVELLVRFFETRS